MHIPDGFGFFPPPLGFGEGSSSAKIKSIYWQRIPSELSGQTRLGNLMDGSLGGAWESKSTHMIQGTTERFKIHPGFAGNTCLPRKGHGRNNSPCADCVPGLTHSQIIKLSGEVWPGREETLKCFSKEFQSLKVKLELREALPKSQAWGSGGFGSSTSLQLCFAAQLLLKEQGKRKER